MHGEEMRSREELVARIGEGRVPDILIVGGGINGVGVFRDLAAQGVPSLLVEAGDFASGTSAAPSRLIHGGLRYLETGETALVRESLIERNLLLKNARHVVHPQPVWIPLRSWTGGALSAVARFFRLKKTPGKKGALPVALGLIAYDLFGRTHRTMPTHRLMSAGTARGQMPVLAPDVKAVAEFYDARISHPERLVLELVADAENDCPDAMALPYLAAGRQQDGRVALEDRLTGGRYEITPKIVINASGAWVDRVQTGLGIKGRLMGGTRGTHLVMRNADLSSALGGRMLYFETRDFRACIALPLDAQHVYVGTTDIRTDDPDDRRYTQAEMDYIFDVLRPILPSVTWRKEDIAFIMAGVRPLPYSDGSVRATGAISRDHRVDHFPAEPDRPFETFTLVGGKWTTYRALAEETADAVLAAIRSTRKTGTEMLEIGGARGFPETDDTQADWIAEIATSTGVEAERVRVLAARYGSGAREMAAAEARDPDQFENLATYTPAEIRSICETERVSRLEDIVLRRTLMAFEGQTRAAILREVAACAAGILGWDAARTEDEVSGLLDYLDTQHGVPKS
ncbi:MAG: glycerol-3-phosphate dehydrogenase/oxidase [Marivita sp.]|uniref:glycerol-3-phosphate dehydrogenase/oxidase n=1 Tax=Marivita sp. TaxID=2003365 RepID=UPI0025C6E0FD|nr:glycerol-3-phosphate dehydrogenase/oxidase [Marivita sp.]MCI5110602.1 glycerol-3-phosphate dehydrogenase/oxidase [Marivita sp.]